MKSVGVIGQRQYGCPFMAAHSTVKDTDKQTQTDRQTDRQGHHLLASDVVSSVVVYLQCSPRLGLGLGLGRCRVMLRGRIGKVQRGCVPAIFPAVATADEEAMLVTRVDDCNTFNPSTKTKQPRG